MTTPRTCPRCGAQLAQSSATNAPCPRCLLQLGFEESAPRAPQFELPDRAELEEAFPQLEILEHVGTGGMGVVYHARQKGLERDVALKLLSAEAAADPAFAERFTREAKALASLSHPAITNVYDFGQVGRFYYLVMEFVDGATLRQVLSAGGLSPREALALVGRMCDALQYAHDHGVVHRDIKPENVLIDRKGELKIIDFGLAKLLAQAPVAGGLTRTDQAMGTWHYMAPEQVERPLEVDHRADIYSLGVVFYELLTGELPLGRFSPPSQRVQVDVRLDDIVMRTLAKEPEQRYQRAGEVKTDLENVREREDGPRLAAASMPPPSRGERRSGSGSALKIVGGIGCGLLLLLTFGCLASTMFFGASSISRTRTDAVETSRPTPAEGTAPSPTPEGEGAIFPLSELFGGEPDITQPFVFTIEENPEPVVPAGSNPEEVPLEEPEPEEPGEPADDEGGASPPRDRR